MAFVVQTEPGFSPAWTPSRSPVADRFSLTQGGLLYRVLLKFGAEEKRHFTVLRTVAAVLVTWLPLLVLSLEQGLAYGHEVEIPFLLDYAANLRFLLALPILITSEVGIDHRLRLTVSHFVKCGLVPDRELPAFEAALTRVIRLRDRLLPELVMVVLAYLPSLFGQSDQMLTTGPSTWHSIPAITGLSHAGWWFSLVSAPMFRFLLIRWLWRMLVWSWLLWQISRLKLVLMSTHPDKAAGLGFLSEGQLGFSSIAFAGSVVIAAQVANAIAYEGATLAGLKYVVIGYCAFIIILLLSPLLLMIPKLHHVRKQGLLEYGVLAADYTRMFESKWLHGRCPSGESLLGSPDIQSLADLKGSYAVVREMFIVPIDKRTLIGLVLATLLPMVPVLFLATPADELIKTVLRLLG